MGYGTRQMKLLPPGEKTWSYNAVLFTSVCAIVVGLWARLYDLGSPSERVFDEIYFPVFARNYLQGVAFFDVHPPLGKFIIAGSIAVFADTPLAWRLMPALFGCALLGLGAVLGWYYFRGWLGALLMPAFLSTETILVSYSRVSLLDGILLFFVLATFFAAWRAERGRQAIWTAVLFGLAISIKWAALGVVVPAAYVLWRKNLLKPFLIGLGISLTIYLLVVFTGQALIGTENPLRGVLEWHQQASRSIQSAPSHPYSSRWWSWPLMLRPVLFFYETDASGNALVISAIGNPVLWWSSTLAVVLGVYEMARRVVVGKESIADHPLVPILLGYVALLLPWVLSNRVSFIYHYLPSYAFALLALVYGLCQCWKYRPWLVVVFAVCVLAAAIFYFPMATAQPMDPESLRRHLWLKTWL